MNKRQRKKHTCPECGVIIKPSRDPRKQFHWHWKNVAGQVIINGYDLTSPESIADYLYWVGYEEQQAKNLEYLLNQDRITL